MEYSHALIKALLTTEKSAAVLRNDNKYLFLVDKTANKLQIKRAVEDVYKVKVKGVNTYIAAGKIKRVRQQAGKTADTKKAVVTLKQGSKIEVS